MIKNAIFEEMYRLVHGSESKFKEEQLLMTMVGPGLHPMTVYVGSIVLQPLVQGGTGILN